MAESIKATFKRRFIAGLFVTIPSLITIGVVIFLFNLIDGILGTFYDLFLGKHVAGLGFLTAVLLIFLVGLFSTNVIGKRIITSIEQAILHIPVFKSIYTAIKQVVDAFSPQNRSSFKKFVIVQYPREGSYAFGFMTKECKVANNGSDKELIAVYIPTNNLYLGDIRLFNKEDVLFTDIPIDDGMKIILSGGIAAPKEFHTGKEL
ncbi:MAG: DUF502 domain-containing protein [Thermodesulfovibrionales bacterium]|nr:DUF502 domain-containing protein [Thermodesulfovibrionales bacterium]